ncbi:hypothetical protein BC829DRAFT_127439 [Chytridium lagenaria]|nr:hypothetical protein BC829DRAFT_127439 [Chytridium lagenaria]
MPLWQQPTTVHLLHPQLHPPTPPLPLQWLHLLHSRHIIQVLLLLQSNTGTPLLHRLRNPTTITTTTNNNISHSSSITLLTLPVTTKRTALGLNTTIKESNNSSHNNKPTIILRRPQSSLRAGASTLTHTHTLLNIINLPLHPTLLNINNHTTQTLLPIIHHLNPVAGILLTNLSTPPNLDSRSPLHLFNPSSHDRTAA